MIQVTSLLIHCICFANISFGCDVIVVQSVIIITSFCVCKISNCSHHTKKALGYSRMIALKLICIVHYNKGVV